MTPLGQNASLITHKISVNGLCDGQKIPPASWAASVYVRHGTRWRAAFHTEAEIVNPAAPAAKPVAENAHRHHANAMAQDTRTDELLALEKVIWDVWKDRDAQKLDGLTASNSQFIDIFGIHLGTKAEALKNRSGEGCEVKTVSPTDAAATMLSPTVGILTFHGSADGTCFGQKV